MKNNHFIEYALIFWGLILISYQGDAQTGSPFDVVPISAITHTAIASGSWTDPDTWDEGVPTDGARVYIPIGHTISIDEVLSERIKTIRLEGELVFAPALNTELQVETIIGAGTSRLQIGNSTAPVAADVSARIIFIDEGPLDLAADFEQFGKGMVMMGETVIHGAEKLTWTSLQDGADAGDEFVVLAESPQGWLIGDEVVIAGTELNNPESDEKRTIIRIDGNKVYLDEPLNLDHQSPAYYDFDVHIANLSRNIVFQSENPEISRRGHLMFMRNLDVRMQYASMYQMGRTNKRVQVDDWFFPTLVADEYEAGERTNIRGRYSCHFHRGGVDPKVTTAALVKGCVVEDDPGWAYVNHSSNVDFIDNISYRVVGGAFQTESGDEIGSFIHNIALHTVNPDYPLLDPDNLAVDTRESSQDFAFQGDAFWFHGGALTITDNVASGSSGHGFIFWTEGQREVGTEFWLQNMFKVANIEHADLLPGLENIQSWWVPLQEFRNNTTYASTNGFAAYYVHATIFEDITDLSPAYLATVHSTFNDLTIWNTSKYGIELQNCERFTFDGLRIINERLLPGAEGIHAWVTVASESNWRNLEVKGFELGMIPPMQGQVHICGGEFTNEVDLLLIPPQRDSRVPGQARDLRIEGLIFGEDAGWLDLAGEVPIRMAGAESLSGVFPFLDPEFQQRQFLIPDRIMVNLEGLGNKRLYYQEQAPDYIPITSENIGEASGSYRTFIENRSNADLFDLSGLAFAGSLLPNDYESHPDVEGGFISDTDLDMLIPDCHFIQEDYLPANGYDDFDFTACWASVDWSAQLSFEPAVFSSCVLTVATMDDPGTRSTSFQFFPNPVEGTLAIEAGKEMKQVRIYDAIGRLVYSKAGIWSKRLQIDLSGQLNGVYFIQVATLDGSLQTGRIVKQ